MLDVADSFSRRRAESAELIQLANAKAHNMHQAIDEIAAWCTRDEIRREAHESDTCEYLLNSMAYVRRIAEGARIRHESFNTLVKEGQAKREQLVNDAEELREYGLLINTTEFASIRELDVQLLRIKQCAEEEKVIDEQAGDCLTDLHARYLAISDDDAGQYALPDDGSNEHFHLHYEVATVTRTIH